MNAIRRIQTDALAVGLACVVNHFVNVRGTEIPAGASVFFYAPGVANVGIVDDEMGRLVFLMLGAGVIKVREFIKRKFAVAFGGPKQMRLIPSIGGQFGKLAQVLVSSFRGISIS